jgi:hypothetical protein
VCREEEALSQGYQGGKPEAQAIGMILLHPMSMDEGEVGSPFSRLLGSSRYLRARHHMCSGECNVFGTYSFAQLLRFD